MTLKTELYTMHANDLLDLLGASGDEGSLVLLVDGEETEFDLEDLCLVVRVESIMGDDFDGDDFAEDVIPFSQC